MAMEPTVEHLTSLFDRALDAVVGMDHRGKVIAWNKAAEELFGWTRDEAMGQSMGDLIVPTQHRASHAKGLKRYNETREGPVLEQRIRITAVDRSNFEFPVELAILPMHRPDGDIFYAFIRSLLFEEARRSDQEMRTQEAEVLLKVATNLIEDTSLEDFTRYCLNAICDVAGLEAAHVFYVRGHNDKRQLIPSGIWYVSEPKFQAVVDDTASRTFTLGEGLPGQAWLSRDVVTVFDISQHDGFIRRSSFSEVGLVQGFAVPIAQEDKTFAVMEFFGTKNARIDDEMIRLVRTIAKQIGLAIQRKSEEEERNILRRELAHRVGNSLTILSAIFRTMAAKATSVPELASSFSVRLQTVARAYQAIPAASHQSSLKGLMDVAFDLLPDSRRPHFDVPELEVAAEAILPLSLLFAELITNHLKHGNPDCVGNIDVSIDPGVGSSSITIVWKEPRSIAPNGSSEGYGSFLIKAMIEDKLSGTVLRTFGADGFAAEIVIPSIYFS